MRITHGLHPCLTRPSAVTAGNFDGVHLGHQAMLSRLSAHARQHGLESVAVTFEPHPREWFGGDDIPARLSSLRDKLAVMRTCGIDHVHICTFNQSLASMPADVFVRQVLLQGLGMHHLLIGDDFRFGHRRTGDFALLRQMGEQLGYSVDAMTSVLSDGERVSSTALREALAIGDLARAQRLAGRPFSISGHVVHGDKRGRQLGFPTANLNLNRRKLPVSGVFAVHVHGLSDTPLPGVANVGMRPTLQSGLQPRLETHILDFHGHLYGKIVDVEFLVRLRDEQKFPDLDALRHQISVDILHARSCFDRLSSELTYG